MFTANCAFVVNCTIVPADFENLSLISDFAFIGARAVESIMSLTVFSLDHLLASLVYSIFSICLESSF